jgi:serine/threonine-protein kinase
VTPGAERAGSDTPRRSPSPGAVSLPPEGSRRGARFIPGTLLAGRYRIVNLVGRGGMGEVYRADDLRLGEAVALKFLAQRLAEDAVRLERLFNEVRTARKVSHPYVCRVHDIDEAEGQHFISMEYVDGEDLAALLRRIGRLPKDKALQIARQICAGLAAVHDQGILHRDLKPANILIDGRGSARITDFGLADLARGIEGAEIRAGTPSYMAPEQLAGNAVTVKSDLYALGLVLYTLFTGRAAFVAMTIEEMLELQKTSAPTSPSSLVEGFDPDVERTIMRCLNRSPDRRPASAMAVAVGLPGANPLEAVLAAGKTPDPDVVAEAGGAGLLPPRVAWTCLATFAAGVALVGALSERTELYRLAPLGLPPEVLADRARDIIGGLGDKGPSLDSAQGFIHDATFLDFIARQNHAATGWERLSYGWPSPILFWYRQGPSYLLPTKRRAVSATDSDPPQIEPGMTRVYLDPSGRLRSFSLVPPRFAESVEPPPGPDWGLLFEKAGLDLETFTSAAPQWTPEVGSDSRAAWDGPYPGPRKLLVRVEAGAYGGRPVYFRVLMPWNRPPEEQVAAAPGPLARASGVVSTVFYVVALLGGVVLARRNWRMGRGDPKGAMRLAQYILGLHLLVWLFEGHHVPDSAEVFWLSTNLAWSVYFSALAWVLYMAVEPDLRRLWPATIVSWVRLLDGRFRDPMVGRDVLLGGLYGVAATLLIQLYQITPEWFGLPSPRPDRLGTPGIEVASLGGTRHIVALFLSAQEIALFQGLLFVMVVVVARLLLRRQWLAVGALLVLGTLFMNRSAGDPYLDLAYGAGQVALWLLVLFRFGVLSSVVGVFLQALLHGHPITFDLSAWYAGDSFLVLFVVTALVAYGFRTCLARRPSGTLTDQT